MLANKKIECDKEQLSNSKIIILISSENIKQVNWSLRGIYIQACLI